MKKIDILELLVESGIGKSTMIDLITGIIKPKKGAIYLSGQNIENMNIYSWREKIGIVMQRKFLRMIV